MSNEPMRAPSPAPESVRREREMTGGRPGIPRTIWFLWFQGIDNAPYIVRECYESWIDRNPSWRVVSLDHAALLTVSPVDYFAGNLAALSGQHRADLLRLDLLAHHGGVWADATCFCVRPLDDWLVPNATSGFFAFHQPRPDRIISNWFLAASAGNVLVSRLFDHMMAYWGDHTFRDEQREFLVKGLTKLLRKRYRTRAWWFSPLFRDWLAISPYFAFTYAFEKLVRQDPDCARIWHDTPKISAAAPHRLYRAGLLAPSSAAVRTEIDSRQVPVYKTSWRLGGTTIPADSNLGYLLRAFRARQQADLPALARSPWPGQP